METPFVSCRCVELRAEGVEVVRSSPDGSWVAVARANAALEIYEASTWTLKLRLLDEGCQSIRTLLWLPLTPAAAVAAASAAGGSETTAAAAAAASRLMPSLLPVINRNSSSIKEQEALQRLQQQQQHDVSLFDWTIVSAGLHGVITLWDLRLLKISVETPSFGGAIFSLCESPAGVSPRFFAAACDDGRLRLFQLQGAAGASVAAVAAAAAASSPAVAAAAAAIDGEADDEYGPLSLVLRATLPKTKGRLLSVCWYSPSLLFAGSATSTIYRFSAAAAAGMGSSSHHSVARVFIADGKMLLQQPRQQQQRQQPQQQQQKSSTNSSSKNGAKKGNAANANDEVLIWCLHSIPQLKLLLSGDSSGCVTVWGLPACVALQRLQLHAADVLNIQAVLIGSPRPLSSLPPSLPLTSSSSNQAALRPGMHHTTTTAAVAAVKNKSTCTVVLVSAGVDGKLATATNSNPEVGGGAWLLGPARYPHRSDIRGLTLLQRRSSSRLFQEAAASSLEAAVASAADSAAAAAAQGGMLATLAAVTGAVDGTVCLNEKFLGQFSAAELKKLPAAVATTPLAKGFHPPVRVVTTAGNRASPTVLFACTEEGLDIWAVDEALTRRSGAESASSLHTPSSLLTNSTRESLKYINEEEEAAEEAKKQKQQQLVKLLRVCLREGLHPRCGDIAPDGALLVAGSREGLHFFGVDFEELQVFDVEGGAACSRRGGVTAVRFLSATTICFCDLYIPKKTSFPLKEKKKKKKAKQQQQDVLPDLLQQLQPEKSLDTNNARNTDGIKAEKTSSAAGEEEDREEVVAAAVAATAAAAALEAAWETTLMQRRACVGIGETTATAQDDTTAAAAFRVCVVDVWKGTQLGECSPLSHPVRAFEVSFDGQLLACLLTSGALLLLDVWNNCTPVHYLPSFPSVGVDISCCTFLYRESSSRSSSSSSSNSSRSSRSSRSDDDVRLCLFSPTNHYALLTLRRVSTATAATAEDASDEAAAAGETRASESATDGISKKRRRHALKQENETAAGGCLWLPRLSRRIRQVPRACVPASGGSVVSAAWLGVSLPSAAAAATSSMLLRQQNLALKTPRRLPQQQQETRETCSVQTAGNGGAALRAYKANQAETACATVESDEEDDQQQHDQHEDVGRHSVETEDEEEMEAVAGQGSKKDKKISRHMIVKQHDREGEISVVSAAAVATGSSCATATDAAEASVLYCLTASTLCRLPLLSGHLLKELRSSSSRNRRRRKRAALKNRCMQVLSSQSKQQQRATKDYVDASSSSSDDSGTGTEGPAGRRRSHRKQQQHSSSSGSSGSSCSEEEVEDNEEDRRRRRGTGSAGPLSLGRCSRTLSSPLASAVAAAIRHATALGSRTTVCAPPLYAAAAAAADRRSITSEESAFSSVAAALTRLPAALRSMLHGNGLQQRGRCLLLAYQARQLQLLLENIGARPALLPGDVKSKQRRQLVEEEKQNEEEASGDAGSSEDGTPRAEDQKKQANSRETENGDEEQTMSDPNELNDHSMRNKKQQRRAMKKQGCEPLQCNGLDLATVGHTAAEAKAQLSVLSTTCSSPSSVGAAAANGDGTDVNSNKSSSKSKTKKSQAQALLTEDAVLESMQASHDEAKGAELAAAVDGEDYFTDAISASGFDSSQGSNTTCASAASEKKKDGNRGSLFHKQRMRQKLSQRQHRQQQMGTLMERLQLQASGDCHSGIAAKWPVALSRPTTIRVNPLHGFLALDMFVCPTASSSGRRQRVVAATAESQREESQEEKSEGEFAAANEREDRKRKKIHTQRTQKNATHEPACARTTPTLVLIEAFSGAAALPENMPTPFNRKRYGT